jgi:nucleotide-binding universal stress UspA family protein
VIEISTKLNLNKTERGTLPVMQKILHPTDFSENSLNALDYALDFCKHSGAGLILAHAYGTPYDLANRSEDEKTVRAKAIESMERLAEQVLERKGFEDIDCETVVAGGSPMKTVLDVTADYNADMIIMGTKGSSDFDNVIFGSTTVDITLEAPCPVMAVPAGIGFSDINHLAYAIDYREEDLSIIWNLIRIASYLDTDLHLFYTARKESMTEDLMFRGFRDLIGEKFQYKSISFDLIYGEDMIKSAQEYAGKFKGIILAMGYYRTKFLNSMSKRDMVKQMANHTHIPLLVMQETED